MRRSKFPYTARSSAKVIRHAVSIDERRAKFRSDLISGPRGPRSHAKGIAKDEAYKTGPNDNLKTTADKPNNDRFRRRSHIKFQGPGTGEGRNVSRMSRIDENHLDPRRSTQAGLRSTSPAISRTIALEEEKSSIRTTTSVPSLQPNFHPDDDDDDADENADQDIEELWFPGCHADLGGGWPLANGEESALSHGPLVWMVREAQRAGLEFDAEKMLRLKCCDDDYNIPALGLEASPQPPSSMPEIHVTGSLNTTSTPDIFHSPRSEKQEPGWTSGLEPEQPRQSVFHQHLHAAFTRGIMHDCLEFNNGLTAGSVISWKIMEYLPFRRMDLRPDGSWKAISLPLPMGETRDIPEDAWIHHSAIRRMEANETYRPGNLIVGGGGRGTRRAPKALGTGSWKVLKGDGDVIGCVMVRSGPSLAEQSGEKKAMEQNGNAR